MSSVPLGSDTGLSSVRAEEDSTAAANVSSTDPAAGGAIVDLVKGDGQWESWVLPWK